MKTITDAEYEEYQLLKQAKYQIALMIARAMMWALIIGFLLLVCWAIKSV